MIDPLDKPLKNVSLLELHQNIELDVIKNLEENKNKLEIYKELYQKYGSGHNDEISHALTKYISNNDRKDLLPRRNLLILTLFVSGVISLLLFYFYENEKFPGPDYTAMIIQVIMSIVLIIGVVKCRRIDFSRIQFFNILKIAFILLSILNLRFPSITYLYVLFLGLLHFQCSWIKKEKFDSIKKLILEQKL